MNKNKGFSLIELMVVVALIGIVTTLAVPTFGDMLQRNQLKAAVQSLQDDMLFARTQAIKRSQNVTVNRTRTSSPPVAGDWCYGLTASAPCDCTVTTTTDADYCEIKIISGANFNTVKMFTGMGNNAVDFRRGTIGNDGVTFYTTNYAARVKFTDEGRVRICTPITVSNTEAAANRPTGTAGLSSTIPNC